VRDADQSQRRLLDGQSEGSIQLANQLAGKCDTIAGGTSIANTVVTVPLTCDAGPSRRWNLY
jgi:hypothetical protein